VAPLPFHDVGEGLEGDDVFVVEVEDARERRLGGVVVAEVEMAPAEDDAAGDVVGIELEADANDLERALDIVALPEGVREGGGEAPRVLRELTLEFFHLARVGHSGPWTRKLLRGLTSE